MAARTRDLARAAIESFAPLAHKRGAGARLSQGRRVVRRLQQADVVEQVDTQDLKSCDGDVMRVRFPPSAPASFVSSGTVPPSPILCCESEDYNRFSLRSTCHGLYSSDGPGRLQRTGSTPPENTLGWRDPEGAPAPRHSREGPGSWSYISWRKSVVV
jgi:hypothetical protein